MEAWAQPNTPQLQVLTNGQPIAPSKSTLLHGGVPFHRRLRHTSARIIEHVPWQSAELMGSHLSKAMAAEPMAGAVSLWRSPSRLHAHGRITCVQHSDSAAKLPGKPPPTRGQNHSNVQRVPLMPQGVKRLRIGGEGRADLTWHAAGSYRDDAAPTRRALNFHLASRLFRPSTRLLVCHGRVLIFFDRR